MSTAVPPAPPEDPAAGGPPREGLGGLVDRASRPETAQAVGLAVATMGAQVIAILLTVVFARLLGTGGYGSLAALLNLSVILFVIGAALQVAAAREGTLGRLGSGAELSQTLERWTKHLLYVTAAVTVLSILLREPLSAVANVDEAWAAAFVPVSACLWLLLSVQRGLLQSMGDFKAVGVSLVVEQVGRLALGGILAVAGLDVTGAYLGTPLAIGAVAIALHVVLRKHLGHPRHATVPAHPLRKLVRSSAIPITALVLVAVLQNVDVIMAKHQLQSEDDAGVWAAAAVAGKLSVWIAVGVALQLVPNATKLAAAGADPRAALVRSLLVIFVVAGGACVLFAIVPGLLLTIAFGPEYERGSTILLLVGAAFGLLAFSYLAVQFLLGLDRRLFLIPLAAVAIAEPLLLTGAHTLKELAEVALLVQLIGAVSLLAFGAIARTARADRSGDPLPGTATITPVD